MTIFLTILSGVIIFVLGQLTLKLLIEPIHECRRTITDIAFSLIDYANIYGNPGVAGNEAEKQASKELRRLSSCLNAQMYLIPYYRFISKIFGLPSRNRVVEAASNLIGLSNGVVKAASADIILVNVERVDKIRNALGIFIPENERIKPRG